ncbi:hypothetical protein GBA52_010973 [Prunus armeniaca]|nr:hypothetical protein GBA52_010973 [Prunus armeniaca]
MNGQCQAMPRGNAKAMPGKASKRHAMPRHSQGSQAMPSHGNAKACTGWHAKLPIANGRNGKWGNTKATPCQASNSLTFSK